MSNPVAGLAGYTEPGAVLQYIKCNFTATGAPAVGNDNTQGYQVGSRWLDVSGHHEYYCDNAATGAANWVQTV